MPTVFQMGARVHHLNRLFVEIQELLTELGLTFRPYTSFSDEEHLVVTQDIQAYYQNTPQDILVRLDTHLPKAEELVNQTEFGQGFVCLTVKVGGGSFRYYTNGQEFGIQLNRLSWAREWLVSKRLIERQTLTKGQILALIRDYAGTS